MKFKYKFFLLLTIFLVFIKDVRASDNSIIVLIYHRFNQPEHKSTSIEIDLFTKQMEFLKENNFNILPLTDLKLFIKKKKELPNKSIFLTIDDGYKSIYENAYPILKKYSFPFSVFLSTDFVSSDKSSDFMSWEMIKELHLNEVEFFNHTSDHNSLLGKNENEIVSSIKKAQKILDKKLGETAKVFSYPFGEYSNETKEVLKKLGFEIAFTQDSGPIQNAHDKFSLSRFPINDDYGKIDRFKLIINTKPLRVLNFYPDNPLLNDKELEIDFTTNFLAKNIKCYFDNSLKVTKTKNYKNQKKMKIVGFEKKQNYRMNCTYVKSSKEIYWFGRTFFAR